MKKNELLTFFWRGSTKITFYKLIFILANKYVKHDVCEVTIIKQKKNSFQTLVWYFLYRFFSLQ